jgi:hypothetical protein
VSTGHEIVERLLDAFYTSGREYAREILANELAQVLEHVDMEGRYWVGIEWLDQVDNQLRSMGVQLPSMLYLQALILGGGDALDRTMLLPTGIQNLHNN